MSMNALTGGERRESLSRSFAVGVNIALTLEALTFARREELGTSQVLENEPNNCISQERRDTQ